MTKKKEILLKEFRNNLDRSTTPYITSIYSHLFSIKNDEDLVNIIEYCQELYNEDKESWFWTFHKSIRQTDFFGEINGYRVVNKLTEDQNKRRNELLKKRHDEIDLYCPNETDEEFEKLKNMPHRIEEGRELISLNRIMQTEEEVSVSGNLDMVLWNTIHLDKDNILQTIFERTFKICS